MKIKTLRTLRLCKGAVMVLLLCLSLTIPGYADEGDGDSEKPAPPTNQTQGAATVPNTGAAVMTIPIQVPPGRRGMQPGLALAYNSGRRNSWTGVGWELQGIGAIHRGAKNGLDYGGDSFIHRTALFSRELVNIGGSYRARIEGAFMRYVKQGDTWIVTDKKGTQYTFGGSANSRQEKAAGQVFAWMVSRVEDTYGNYMTYTYTTDQGEIYLDRIDYTAHTSGLSPVNSVRFNLATRPDPLISYNKGYKTTTAKRLDSIEVSSTGGVFRKYILEYCSSGACATGWTGQSVLTRVLTTNGNETSSLPPVVLYYRNWEQGESFNNSGSFTPGTGSLYPAGDINGDGRSDLLGVDEDTVTPYFSNGSTFAPGASSQVEGTVVLIKDINGDGKTDILTLDAAKALRIYISDGVNFTTDGWSSPTLPISNPIFRIRITPADINGDGRTDILVWEVDAPVIYIYLSAGSAEYPFYEEPVSLSLDNFGDNRSLQFPGDVDGDGRADLLVFWRETGTGNRGGVLFRSNGTNFTLVNSSLPFGLGDIIRVVGDSNGDGRTDICYVPN